MPLPKEELLHHIWQHRLFASDNLFSVHGKSLKVLKPGTLNKNAGPDFQNARIEIDGIEWVGNVEIHVKSSDWITHNHQEDESYSNIILHVVFLDDLQVLLGNFPTLELSNRISNQVLHKYNQLIDSNDSLPCSGSLTQVPEITKVTWLDSLLIQRLERKSNWMNALVDEFGGDLEQAFLAVSFRSFGMKVNAVPFELLGKQTPWKVLSKHQDNIIQLEAILFGVAGFLKAPNDEYSRQLQTEFKFLQYKYELEVLNKDIWKFMRLRPANFPTVRIAQIATLYNKIGSLYKWFSSVSTKSLKLDLTPSDYWETHYSFGKKSIRKKKPLGKSMANNLYINAVVPFLFVVSKRNSNQDLQSLAFRILEEIEAEKNSKTNLFGECGVKPQNAGESQALIELKTQYCEHKKCLSCSFGSTILKRGL